MSSSAKQIAPTGGNLDLAAEYRRFDLAGYIQKTTGTQPHNGKFRPCPLCGKDNDFSINPSRNTFKCASRGISGNVLNYIMHSMNYPKKLARQYFMHSILGIPRKMPHVEAAERRDHAIKKRVTNDSTLHKKLLELQPQRNYSLNDKGMGCLFADLFQEITCYNTTAKSWYFYDGKRWVEDTGDMIVAGKAKALADALLVYGVTIEDDTQKKHFLDFVMKLGQLAPRNTMLQDARSENFIKQTDLDGNHALFNCQNGTLNLDTFEFKPHCPHDKLSKISNVVYDPEATAPLWAKFINEVMENKTAKIRYLKKALGIGLTADTSLETLFILFGASSRNGKSTLIETNIYMHGGTGGYAMTIQPQTLAQKQNKDSRQASGDIARLNGCRFLNCAEIPKRMILDISLVKTLLGRDSVTARHLYEREFEFTPHFKLFINTNYLPVVSDDTLFASGRVNVISFDRHFTPDEQDKGLKDKLRSPAELSGIFNWCIEGLKLFRQEGLRPPVEVVNATAEYRTSSDKLGNFFSECMESTGKNSKASDVYNVYRQWCDTNGFGCENKGNFFDELKAKNFYAETGTIDGKSWRRIVIGYEINDDLSPLGTPLINPRKT